MSSKSRNDNGDRCIIRIILKAIENRNPPSKEPTVDGKKGFLFFDKDGHIVFSLHWEHYFKHILKKYNSTHRRKLPPITPHICRHTYCSNMAKSGMNPKILQYLMGHSDISITLNTYTHVKYEDAVGSKRSRYINLFLASLSSFITKPFYKANICSHCRRG